MRGSRATSGAAPVPQDGVRTGPRIPPSGELVNVPEFETVAKTVLSPAVYARLGRRPQRVRPHDLQTTAHGQRDRS